MAEVTGIPDSSDIDEFRFDLPKTRIPEPIMRGVRGWRTSEGYLVLRLHYSCDPERATKEWIEETSQGYRGGTDGSDWQREMEIDFGSYAGRPVYSQFDKTQSVRPCRYNPHLPLWRGWDFGYRNPAVVFLQLWPDDTLIYLHEMFPTLDKEQLPGISTADLAVRVQSETDRLFPGAQDSNKTAGVYDFCDPAGQAKKETSDFSSVEILQQYGMDPEFASVGRKNRIAYSRVYAEGRHPDGSPKFLINPHCTLGIEAFAAAYRYPNEDKGTADREMPDLSKKVQSEPFVHLMDAYEYVVGCNLEVTYQSRRGFYEEAPPEQTIDDLASMYLGASMREEDRLAQAPARKIGDEDLEEVISEIIGEDSLADAWDTL